MKTFKCVLIFVLFQFTLLLFCNSTVKAASTTVVGHLTIEFPDGMPNTNAAVYMRTSGSDLITIFEESESRKLIVQAGSGAFSKHEISFYSVWSNSDTRLLLGTIHVQIVATIGNTSYFAKTRLSGDFTVRDALNQKLQLRIRKSDWVVEFINPDPGLSTGFSTL